MPALVKVGLDQWALASTAVEVNLLTSGLSGCIGLVLANPEQMVLAHVFSGCNETNWVAYETQLNTLFNIMHGKVPITISGGVKSCNYEACLVYSDEVDLKQVPFNKVKAWLNKIGVNDKFIHKHHASGCRVSHSNVYGLEVLEYENDKRKEYLIPPCLTISGAGAFLLKHGGLSEHAADAGGNL